MSTVTRQGLQVLTDRLGDALASLTTSLGNTDTKPGALLRLEAAFCRLRGSTLFHDDETVATQKTVDQWCAFGSDDPVGFGLQSAQINTPQASTLPFGDFTAAPFNPNAPAPCLEGWGVTNYHAWKYWPAAKRSDETLTQYNTRLTENHPVKFVLNSPVAVPLFDRARRITLQKPLGFSGSRIKFSLTRSQLEGVKHWLPASQNPADITNASFGPVPLDIRFYCFGTYSLSFDGTSWVQTHGSTPSSGDAGTLLNHLIQASHTTADTWDVYIDIPTGINTTWTPLDWWPIVMYVGTSDSSSLLTITPSSNSAIQANATKVFEWNNYFRNEIVDRVQLDALGGHGIYLVSRNKTHFSFVDGQFSDPATPPKYVINSQWPAASYLGIPNTSSLNGWVQDIQPGCAICVLLTTRNQGSSLPEPGYNQSADAVAIPSVIVGPQITPEFIPEDWGDCPYFPPLPEDHNLIAKVVLVRAPGPIYGLVEAVQSSKNAGSIYAVNGGDGFGRSWNIHANISIAWMEQSVPTHAAPEIGDEELSLRLLRPLRNRLSVYRNILKDNGVLNAAYQSVVPASRVSLKVAQNRGNLADPTSLASRVMHMVLKKPNDPLLQTTPNTPIKFSPYGNTLIYSLTGKPGSVDLLRLDSDKFYMTGNKLDTASQLEIYLEPSDNCGINDRYNAGNRLGWDYTLRLELETGTENLLLKDWYINSSKYFLSDGDYNDKVNQGNSMVGYFKYGTPAEIAAKSTGVLQTMNEFRLYGYAGVVPDLVQDGAVVLDTREVSPPDSTQITEAQFIQNLKNQGYNQAQIDDAISEFLDNGGVFYVVNTNHYSNLFKEIKSAGLCVSQFNIDDTYWVPDYHINDYFRKVLVGDESPPPPPPTNTLRADAFTLATAGLANGSTLESWGSQATAVDSSVDISHPTYTQTDKIIVGTSIAFKINPQADCTISDLSLSIKVIVAPGNNGTTLLNTTGQLNISLYSDSQDSSNPGPASKIAALKPIMYSDLTTSYQYLEQIFNYKFLSGVQYWLVIEKSEEPNGGLISINSRTPTNIFVKSKDYNNNWVGDSLTAWNLLYDGSNVAHPTTNTNTGNWMQTTYATTALRFSASSTFSLAKIALHFKNKLYSSNNSGSLTNAATEGFDVALYTNNSGQPGTLIASGTRILYKDITSDLTTLTSNLSASLTNGTTYWIVLTKSEEPKGGTVFVDGLSPYNGDAYVSYDGITFVEDYGDEYIEFHTQPQAILGVFNRQTSNVSFFLPGPNTTRAVDPIYKLDGYWAYSTQKFDQPTSLAVYPRAVYNTNTSTWEYVRFANDVYGVARLLVGTQVVTVHFKFTHAASDADAAPNPIVLSDTNGPILADGLLYLGVAKTQEELETPTNGAPPGDILVLRST